MTRAPPAMTSSTGTCDLAGEFVSRVIVCLPCARIPLKTRACDHTGLQTLVRTVVSERMEEQWLGVLDLTKTRRIGVEIRLTLVRRHPRRHPRYVWRQDVETEVAEDPIVNRPENVIDRSVDAVGLIQAGGSARRRRYHRLLTVEHPRVVLAARRIGEPTRHHAIHPALQDGGHAEPPHRILEDHHVAPEQLLLFRVNIGCWRCRRREHMFLFGRKIEEIVVQTVACEIVDVQVRAPVQLVQIADLNFVTERLQCRDGSILERAVERLRFGVCKYDEDFHPITPEFLRIEGEPLTPVFLRVSRRGWLPAFRARRVATTSPLDRHSALFTALRLELVQGWCCGILHNLSPRAGTGPRPTLSS